MKYFVTFCAMDHTLSGNIFWHSCILLSVCPDNEKMEVIDNWGFYGVPTTSRSGLLDSIKIKLGLDVDFKGNHGMLKHEELRFMDLGYALHGVTFELTREKFEQLQERSQKAYQDQNQAVDEIAHFLGLDLSSSQKSRIYPHEIHSRIIYEIEKLQAMQQKRSPRLHPFEINPTMTFWGPALNKSLNCKTQMVNLLTGILTQDQIDRITEHGKHPTVPRYSGDMEQIFLHSSGPLRTYTKSSGEVVYYRDFVDREVKLHWTLPPQEIEPISRDTNNLLLISPDFCYKVKQIISRLQRVEWIFINAPVDNKHVTYKNDLIQRIRECYEAFAYPEPKSLKAPHSEWGRYFLNLFSLPKNKHEGVLVKKIDEAELLLNELYMAMADGWQIDDNCLSEIQYVEPEQVPGIDADDGDDREIYYNPITALAAYLPEQYKKLLCSIIKRTYAEPSDYEENEEQEQRVQLNG